MTPLMVLLSILAAGGLVSSAASKVGTYKLRGKELDLQEKSMKAEAEGTKKVYESTRLDNAAMRQAIKADKSEERAFNEQMLLLQALMQNKQQQTEVMGGMQQAMFAQPRTRIPMPLAPRSITGLLTQ